MRINNVEDHDIDYIKHGLTIKQKNVLCLMLSTFRKQGSYPTIKEIATALECSYQGVRRYTNILEMKGLIPTNRKVKKLCEVELCQNVIIGNGLCRKHYDRLRKRGTLKEYVPPPKVNGGSCKTVDCKAISVIKGLCNSCYYSLRTYGDPKYKKTEKVPDICTIRGCEREGRAKGLCNSHYHSFMRFKKIGRFEVLDDYKFYAEKKI